jgi:hypothetical protein
MDLRFGIQVPYPQSTLYILAHDVALFRNAECGVRNAE